MDTLKESYPAETAAEPMPFKDVLLNAQGGDGQAFAELWGRTGNSARNAIAQKDGSAKGEDHLQTTAMTAFRYLESFTPPEEIEAVEPSFRNWLKKIGANTVLDDVRYNSRRPQTVSLDEKLTEEGTATFADVAEAAASPGDGIESYELVMRAMATVPETFRKAVFAVDVMGLTNTAYANRENMSRTTVGTQLIRGRGALREAILSGEAGEELQAMALRHLADLDAEASVA